MNLRTLSVTLLAIICGASAAIGVNQFNKRRGVASVETVSVVVAATRLARGSVLSDDVVKLQQWPKNMLPVGAVTDVEAVTDRTLIGRAIPGEPILEGKLAPEGAGRGLAAMIPSGMRAFTIRTANVAAGVAGFILPGNRVDVLFTMTGSSAGSRSGGAVTTTLLQNMEILAIDQHLEAPDENKMDPKGVKSVTLLVTPHQAAKLGLASSRGTLQLSLRRPEDHSDADTLPATMADLRFDQERPLPPLEEGQSSPSGINRFLGSIANVVSSIANATKDMDLASSVGGTPLIAQIHTIRGSHRGSIQIMENRRSARVNSR